MDGRREKQIRARPKQKCSTMLTASPKIRRRVSSIAFLLKVLETKAKRGRCHMDLVGRAAVASSNNNASQSRQYCFCAGEKAHNSHVVTARFASEGPATPFFECHQRMYIQTYICRHSALSHSALLSFGLAPSCHSASRN